MRRTSLIAACAAALLLAGCGTETEDPGAAVTSTPAAAADDEMVTATTSPEPSASETTTEEPTTTTTSSSTTSTAPTSAAPAPSPTTEEPAPSPTTEVAAPGTPSAVPVPAPPPGVECSTGAYSPGTLRTGQSPQPTVDRAQQLFHAAMACDQDTLISQAEQDTTVLSFGGGTAEELLALPDVEGRYLALAALLTGTTPVQNDDLTWVWPAAAVEASDAHWQELVEAGLYTQDQVDQMRSTEGYYGWRVGIAPDGTWSFMVAGD